MRYNNLANWWHRHRMIICLRIVCFVYLQSPLNALNKPKEERDTNCNPECVPLASFSSVIPQLSDCFRLRLVECFFKYDKAIMPKLIFFNVSQVVTEITTVQNSSIQFFWVVLLAIPLLSGFISLREQKS